MFSIESFRDNESVRGKTKKKKKKKKKKIKNVPKPQNYIECLESSPAAFLVLTSICMVRE